MAKKNLNVYTVSKCKSNVSDPITTLSMCLVVISEESGQSLVTSRCFGVVWPVPCT